MVISSSRCCRLIWLSETDFWGKFGMFKKTLALFAGMALMMVAPAAFCLPGAAAGDCNGDGVVDQADLDALIAANGTSPQGTTLVNCDYDADGFISLADANAHLGALNE